MHVCLATHEFPPIVTGGISTYYSTLARLLAREGHKVSVLTIGDGSYDHLWHEHGIRIIRLDESVTHFQQVISRFWDPIDTGQFRYYASIGLAMRDWLKEFSTQEQIDVLDVPDYFGTAAFLLELDLPPVTVTCHGSIGQVAHHQSSPLNLGDRFATSLEHIAIGTCDEVICYSPANQNDWLKFSARNPRFVTTPFDVSQVVSEPPTPSQSSVLTCVVVARLQSWKGVIETVNALRSCRSKGIPLQVHWIGRDTLTAPGGGSMKSYIESTYDDLWGTSFVWTEALPPEDVRRLQRQADLLLVPSRWDTFNFSAVEAMATGNPVIVSQGAGASYLCHDGENALVIAPGSSDELITAIERLHCDPRLRAVLGRTGRQTILEVFEPTKIVKEHIDAYECAQCTRKFRQQNPYSYSPISFMLEESGLLANEAVVLNRFSSRSFLSIMMRKFVTKLKRAFT